MSDINMASTDNKIGTHEHDGAGCCETGMCISAALVDNFHITELAQIHTHIASPINKMTSVDKPNLMRPPSL
jgi:hypothetical protein